MRPTDGPYRAAYCGGGNVDRLLGAPRSAGAWLTTAAAATPVVSSLAVDLIQ